VRQRPTHHSPGRRAIKPRSTTEFKRYAQENAPMAKGFVYVFSNAALAGLVKIGYSVKVPEARACELQSTSIPGPFVVEYYCLVDDAPTLEASVHDALVAARYRPDREFFRVSVEEAIRTIETLAIDREHSWRRTPPRRTPPVPPIVEIAPVRPSSVECSGCGARYVSATHCPKCRIKLKW
jgi:hypothetical protein